MDYQSCLDFLSEFHTKVSPHENNRHLQVMEELFGLFDIDHLKMNIVQITGSCGKGSTAVFLSSILESARISHGLFTGPHLVRYEERFVIDGEMITSLEFTEIVSEIVEKTKAYNNMRDVGHKHLMTLIAMLWFSRKGVPLVIFENGAGGASDPSNVFHPVIACLTEITLDHTHLLGKTIEAITKDKAAIIKDSVGLAVCGMNNETARDFLMNMELSQGKTFSFINRDFKMNSTSEGLTYTSACGQIPSLELGLSGEHQCQNAANAVRLAEGLMELGYLIDKKAIKRGLQDASLPGRLETIVKDGTSFILDGAHNPLELKVLGRSLEKLGYSFNVILISFASKKNVEAMLRALNRPDNFFVIAPSPFIARQQSQSDVETVFKKLNLNYCYTDDVDKAFEKACGYAANEAVLVTGSLYLVGRIREILISS